MQSKNDAPRTAWFHALRYMERGAKSKRWTAPLESLCLAGFSEPARFSRSDSSKYSYRLPVLQKAAYPSGSHTVQSNLPFVFLLQSPVRFLQMAFESGLHKCPAHRQSRFAAEHGSPLHKAEPYHKFYGTAQCPLFLNPEPAQAHQFAAKRFLLLRTF